MSNDNIKIRVVRPEDNAEVLKFVIEHFFKDEPLSFCESETVHNKNFKVDILGALKYGTSILAVQETEEGEELVAVNIAEPLGPSSIEELIEAAEKEGNTKYGEILKLLGIVSRNADVFNRYGVDKILSSFLTCVKPSARGKNLGTRLKIELMALGKSLGYKLLTADCTSFYSTRICERLGMDRVYYIAYTDYVTETNQQIFNPSAPHVGISSFAIRL